MPAFTPVTTPVAGLTVAAAPLLLAHVPPAGVLFSVVVRFLQIVSAPVGVAANAITVTVAVAVQLPSA